MPVFEVGLDDGRTLRIEADDQTAALAGVAHFQAQEKGPAPSGAVAGFREGLSHLGNADTAKYFAGADTSAADRVSAAVAPKDYVPANVTNGSVNPLNWNWAQLPQAVAEAVPGVSQDALAAATAAATAKKAGLSGKAAALAGLIGAGASTWSRVAGKNAKTDAEIRTGDKAAEPQSDDLKRSAIHSTGEAALGALLPTRLIPGVNKVGTVGLQGLGDAAKKYLGTAATGAAGAAGADVVNQVGSTAGTDNGVQFNPDRTLNAALTGAATGAAMATPRLAADAGRAGANREFGGENMDATRAAATRLQTAGDGQLGKTIGGGNADFNAMQTVRADVRNELGDAARAARKSVPLSAEADNALQRAQNGSNLTPGDIATIESATAAAPDGANVTHLARQVRMLQLLQNKGSFDPGEGRWSGGLSGMMDKRLSFISDPTRALTGAVATAAGLHLLGTASPAFAAAGIGAYGGARVLDAMTGMRSPARTFAEHYADHAAQLRLPQTAQAAPAATSGPAQPWGPVPTASGPTGPQVPLPVPPQQLPWGPRPQMAGPTGPQVTAPAAPTPAPPQFNPMALAALKKTLKAGLPATPAPEPEPAPAAPQFNPVAVAMLKQKLKTGLAMPADNTPPSAASVAGIKVDPVKITKINGKLNVDDPYASASDGFYEAIPEANLWKRGLAHDQVAAEEARRYNVREPARPNYEQNVVDTMSEKSHRVEAVAMEAPPQDAPILKTLLDQIHHRNDRSTVAQAILFYGRLMTPDTAARLRRTFSPSVLHRLWPDRNKTFNARQR